MASIVDFLKNTGTGVYSNMFGDEEKKEEPGKKKKAPRISLPSGQRVGRYSYNMPLAMEPMSEEDFNALSQRDTLGLREQREGYQTLANRIADMREKAEGSKDKVDFTNLLLAGDVWNKTQTAKGYKKPKSKQERLDQILGLEASLSKLAGGLSKTETDVLKAQFQPYRSGSVSVGESSGSSGKGKGGKMLSALEARRLSELKGQANNMDALYAQWKALEPDAVDNIFQSMWQKGKGALDLGSKEHHLKKISGLFGQAVAKAFEGGRLSDKDRDFYLKQIPQVGDPDHIVTAKVQNLKNLMKLTYDQNIETFRETGFNVDKYTPINNKKLSPLRDEAKAPKTTGTPGTPGTRVRQREKPAGASGSFAPKKIMSKEEFYKMKGW